MIIRCSTPVYLDLRSELTIKHIFFQNANPRMANLNEEVGGAFAGVYPDCNALRDYAVREAQRYLKDYREPISDKKLAAAVSFSCSPPSS